MNRRNDRGSVLIIVMWICLGLIALVVYFANSANSELEAAANKVGEMEAKQAVNAGIRYAAYVLNNYAIDGIIPNSGIAPDPTTDYSSSALQVGDKTGDPEFWFIGRDVNNAPGTDPVFSLVDESSKLNLNNVTASMLEQLPMTNMTTDLATAIVAWRSRSSQSSSSSASSNYSTMDPPRLNKGAPFESTDELRLVYGATLDLLFGEDTNLNGALDPNEDDGDASPPHDNQDGTLNPGMFEYVTAFTSAPTTTITGTTRVNVLNRQGRGDGATGNLGRLMTRKGISRTRVTAIMNRVGQSTYTSVAQFYVMSGMTSSEFALIHTSITGAPGSLVNINTASEAVLACIPGIGPNNAQAVVNYRLGNPTALTSLAWLRGVIGTSAMQRAGPYITDQSYQFSADIAAVGRFGRGYHREKVVFDTSKGIPRIIYRQDLTPYGWALGQTVRTTLKTATLR